MFCGQKVQWCCEKFTENTDFVVHILIVWVIYLYVYVCHKLIFLLAFSVQFFFVLVIVLVGSNNLAEGELD